MTNEMVSIRYIVDNLGLTESAVKQARQQQRLMNTKRLERHGWFICQNVKITGILKI